MMKREVYFDCSIVAILLILLSDALYEVYCSLVISLLNFSGIVPSKITVMLYFV